MHKALENFPGIITRMVSGFTLSFTAFVSVDSLSAQIPGIKYAASAAAVIFEFVSA